MIFILQDYFKEFRHNLKLAYPVIISLLGHTFVQLMDNVMVGQLGTADLAAVSLGNSFIIVAMCLGIGFSTAITPLVAEADGVNNLIRTKEIFYHGIILCFMLGIILSVLVIICRPLMYRMGQPIEVVELAYPYLKWVSISLFPLVVFEAFKNELFALLLKREDWILWGWGWGVEYFEGGLDPDMLFEYFDNVLESSFYHNSDPNIFL